MEDGTINTSATSMDKTFRPYFDVFLIFLLSSKKHFQSFPEVSASEFMPQISGNALILGQDVRFLK